MPQPDAEIEQLRNQVDCAVLLERTRRSHKDPRAAHLRSARAQGWRGKAAGHGQIVPCCRSLSDGGALPTVQGSSGQQKHFERVREDAGQKRLVTPSIKAQGKIFEIEIRISSFHRQSGQRVIQDQAQWQIAFFNRDSNALAKKSGIDERPAAKATA